MFNQDEIHITVEPKSQFEHEIKDYFQRDQGEGMPQKRM